MDETEIRTMAQNLAAVASITKAELLWDAATMLSALLGEKKSLEDQLWSATRQAHATDPWEAEDA